MSNHLSIEYVPQYIVSCFPQSFGRLSINNMNFVAQKGQFVCPSIPWNHVPFRKVKPFPPPPILSTLFPNDVKSFVPQYGHIACPLNNIMSLKKSCLILKTACLYHYSLNKTKLLFLSIWFSRMFPSISWPDCPSNMSKADNHLTLNMTLSLARFPFYPRYTYNVLKTICHTKRLRRLSLNNTLYYKNY